jgi:hypothetical protein
MEQIINFKRMKCDSMSMFHRGLKFDNFFRVVFVLFRMDEFGFNLSNTTEP